MRDWWGIGYWLLAIASSNGSVFNKIIMFYNFYNLVNNLVLGRFWTDLDSGLEFCVKNCIY